MKSPENPQNTVEICLLDYSYDELRLILGDPGISASLTEFNKSSALERIDELMNLQEAPPKLFLSKEAREKLRHEWTVIVPTDLPDAIDQLLSPRMPID